MRRFLLGVALLQLCLLAVAQTPRPRKIAVFGSSVAFGTGDETRKGGYTGLLREMLEPRGWEVLNVSRPGDTTITAASRWSQATSANPGYLVIGLALSNEGLLEAETTSAKDAVFKQFADGIRGFVDRARKSGIVPIVNLVYPRMTYTPVEYAYVNRMNLLLNSWDVPSVNLLGALDDGEGRYVRAFDTDDRHPNAAGHREFFYAFVPSLFEALEKGKPLPTKPTGDTGFARISAGAAPLAFEPQDPMHSFTLAFTIRAQGNGDVANINTNAILVQNGKWAYKAADGSIVASQIGADAQWHQIVLSHYEARGETLLFIDGKLAGKTSERIQPKRFTLGGPRDGEYKDLFIYRSALNADEAAAMASGTLLQASLEIYAPVLAENRAQSLSSLKMDPGRITPVAK
jgi:lysophospholipase L1-like esterase